MSVNSEFFSRKQRYDAAAIPAGVWRAADQSLSGVDLQSMLPRWEDPAAVAASMAGFLGAS